MKMISQKFLFGLIFFFILAVKSTHDSQSNQNTVDKTQIASRMIGMSVPFIVNEGQVDEQVSYYANTFGGTVFITKTGEIVYSLPKIEGQEVVSGVTLKEKIAGGMIKHIEGESQAPTRVSYFKGKDPAKWVTGLATYNQVNMGEVYDGIELKLAARGNNVEKLFTVKPGADPTMISMKIEGGTGLSVNDEGALVVESGLGSVVFTKPVAYQYNAPRSGLDGFVKENAGPGNATARTEIEVAYIVNGNEYGFRLGEYDPTKAVIIDPLLASTFLGGDSEDYGYSIILDNDGNVYVTGWAYSSDFPTTPGAYDDSLNGGDAYIAKLDGNLTTLLASTFLGGNHYDYGNSITLDAVGNVYVTGETWSSDFPTTSNAYDESYNGGSYDAFITRLDGNLTTLLASTFLGGTEDDRDYSITLDAGGNVYITGETWSPDFPTTTNAYDESYNGGARADVFTSKLNNNLTTLLASTFLGGTEDDRGYSITLDAGGNIYVTGETWSPDFPTIPGAYDESYNGGVSYADVFTSKLDNNLTTLLTSTFLGGTEDDRGYSITLDAGGNIYVTGETWSPDFPITPGAYDESYNGGGVPRRRLYLQA